LSKEGQEDAFAIGNPDFLGKSDEEILTSIALPSNSVFMPQEELDEYKQTQLQEIKQR